MSSPFKTKEFLALKAKWEKKLEKEGLADLDNDEGQLKGITHAERFKATYNPSNAQAKHEYYRAAGFFLYEHKFETTLERKIWELHIEGIGIREIVKILKKQGLKSIYKSRVHSLLQPLVEKCVRDFTKK